jgi:FPC/CPF motif-containing protein YcgG
MNKEFTGAEKVLFKMTYEFAVNVEKLTEDEATEKAMNKIIQKRMLGDKLAKEKFTY